LQDLRYERHRVRFVIHREHQDVLETRQATSCGVVAPRG
jgi:hypothetical protein